MTLPNTDPSPSEAGRMRLSGLLALIGAVADVAPMVSASALAETPPAAWAPRETHARPHWLS